VHRLRDASAQEHALAHSNTNAWCPNKFMKEKKKNITLVKDNATEQERRYRELNALLFGELVFPQMECPKSYFTLHDLDGKACQQISTKKIPF
jgi:hypothetical protein